MPQPELGLQKKGDRHTEERPAQNQSIKTQKLEESNPHADDLGRGSQETNSNGDARQ